MQHFLSTFLGIEQQRIILASQSPRRIQLLRDLGLNFEIHPAAIKETIPPGADPIELARKLAYEKAHAVYQRVGGDLVIAADTLVTLEGHIFPKPESVADATRMLQTLQGTTHEVITGLALITPQTLILDHGITRVTFYPMSDAEIAFYLTTQEPFDKAGAYAIQGKAAVFIEKIEGDFFNVVGFPVGKFFQHLKRLFPANKR